MITITDRVHFKTVVAFAKRHHLLHQLARSLEYLGGQRNCGWKGRELRLYPDRPAPYSFSFAIFRPKRDWKPGEPLMEYDYNGGLIYQGPLDDGDQQVCDGSFPTLTVSLAEGVGWFSHT